MQPTNEFERLIELTELDLDYSNLQIQLEDLTKLAARIAGTEMSLVNLIDSYTQWSVANCGIDIQQMPREESICQYVIMDGKPLEVKDLKEDARFSQRPYVVDGPKMHYYYGVPLTTGSGVHLGALCVMDKESKDISPENQELLVMVANQVIRRLEALKTIKSLEDRIDELHSSKLKVSHDIRNPISGIIGLAEMMKDEVKNARVSEVIELLDVIQKGGQSLLELADSILHQEDRRAEPGENEFSCDTFTQKLQELYLPQAKVKQVRLEFEVGQENSSIFFSKNRLLQITGNLISNSIKFTPVDGLVRISVSVDVSDEASASNTLLIRVLDTGTGMSAAKIEAILSGQVDSETGTSGEHGYGFGLSLVMHLIKKAEGSLKIKSELGHGSEVEVRLPI
ncbi:GAF domain-containing sensor histidine kinase [Coraliomargarita sp. SDUM461004]|uniref:histidine kinase n=1 Tax=Thalassobacterium sedimentorum TaxID=3041258 RepID=A0ABU1AG48_9BACT|nr:GAF domain-containing sensor histidine kinase [Coraliomargarita sp. SDUM461004]MDQ8193809.1 GAF domain-containing sensor histidine kinase [Coraliomargarita sp. SDUM461004]